MHESRQEWGWCRFNSLEMLTDTDASDSLHCDRPRLPVAIFTTMSVLKVKKQMESMALYVSAFLVFAFSVGARSAEGSCGDYLNHSGSSTKKFHSDMGNDSLPMPVCQSGNCRSAPSIPPAEPSYAVLIRRQASDFQPIAIFSNSPDVQFFEFFDEDLPSSVTLEVLTPPPLLTV